MKCTKRILLERCIHRTRRSKGALNKCKRGYRKGEVWGFLWYFSEKVRSMKRNSCDGNVRNKRFVWNEKGVKCFGNGLMEVNDCFLWFKCNEDDTEVVGVRKKIEVGESDSECGKRDSVEAFSNGMNLRRGSISQECKGAMKCFCVSDALGRKKLLNGSKWF